MTGPARVLIVDDNALNLKLTTLVLREHGFDVQTATDAEQALEALQTFRPHAILMDVQLPGMDGFELTRRLKSNPATRGMVVIALTAYAMKGDEQLAYRAGCDDYISKPIDTKTLASRVEAAIRRTEVR
jgi:CheY-like chemotaxis protein